MQSIPLPSLAVLALAVATPAQEPRIRTVAVAGNVHMLMGQGGNIGVCVGEDGTFLIDDQFAPMHDQIKAAVEELTDEPVRFLVNTHWHGDHTGGNERFGEAGAVIVAHENVRKRLSVEQFQKSLGRKTPPSPKAALPVITFASDVAFHMNGEDIRVHHVDPAHTDGDSIVWFEKANVVHMGDVFFNGAYPFIDLDSGGSLRGMIAAVDHVLGKIDDRTKVIPGHGELGDKAALQRYRDLLAEVQERMRKLIAAGRTIDDVLAEKPTAEWDEQWGKGFMKPEVWVRIVYDAVKAEK